MAYSVVKTISFKYMYIKYQIFYLKNIQRQNYCLQHLKKFDLFHSQIYIKIFVISFFLSPYILLFKGGITIVNYERKIRLIFNFYILSVIFKFSIYSRQNNGMSFVFVMGNMLSGFLEKRLCTPLSITFYTFIRKL